jgi:hypothetical protein
MQQNHLNNHKTQNQSQLKTLEYHRQKKEIIITDPITKSIAENATLVS